MEEVEYRREMNRNYMVICPKAEWNDTYMLRMISGNKIPGLLMFQEKWMDGKARYYYDITSKQPLHRILEHRSLTANEIRTLISDLLYALQQMERYLLDEGLICMEPEYIYMEPDTFRGHFCLIPGRYSDFSSGFFNLAQYILDHVDHSDGDAVVLAFSIFRECRKENFGIRDIENCLEEKKEEEAIIPVGSSDKMIQGTEKDTEEYEPRDLDDVVVVPQTTARKAPAGFIVSLMILMPGCICFVFGARALFEWKWLVVAAEIVFLALFIFFLRRDSVSAWFRNDKPRIRIEDKDNPEVWENVFGANGEFCIQEMDAHEEREGFMEYTGDEKESDDENMQTVLLSTKQGNINRRVLFSADKGLEISMEYFPYLIGKNKSMSDYCLNEPGVSRLHVKFECKDGGYYVTDLNSTNGTMVNGELLETNETRKIRIGDEIVIASERFVFH